MPMPILIQTRALTETRNSGNPSPDRKTRRPLVVSKAPSGLESGLHGSRIRVSVRDMDMNRFTNTSNNKVSVG